MWERRRTAAGREMESVMNKIRIGTRGSRLALKQAALVQEALQAADDGLQTEIVILRTKGDIIQDKPLAEIGEKGVFSSEFEQALQELCNYADNKCSDGRLPIAVRFILDDFATNVKINEFPRIVSCIRSRGISAMMMIQSEAQLQAAYGEDGQTIISSADTYLYLGGNDLQTAQAVAMRGDIPLDKILSLPIGECIIFRRGSRPVQTRTFRLDEHRDYFQVKENRDRKSTRLNSSH